MKQLKQLITVIITALFGVFVPELAEDGLVGVFVTFGAFAPAVMVIAAKVNTWQQWEDAKAWLSTGGVALVLAYLGYFVGTGIMESVPIWHPLLYAIGAWAVAALGFGLDIVKSILAAIFDYNFKRK